jgi:hypothetical protein
MKKFGAILGPAMMGTMLAAGANAAPESVPVNVEWIAPITIVPFVNLQFGLLDLNMAATETVTINPDDTWSDPDLNVVGGTRAAARLTITATASQGITITAGSPSNGTFYDLDTFMCNYNNDIGDTDCSAGYAETSAATATLLVGAKLTGTGGAGASTDDSTFDVTIVYQ